MKIAIHTVGTRGDVQPHLALAVGLQAEGHDVQIAAPSQFETFVGLHGIHFAHLPGEFLALMDTPEAKAVLAGSKGFSAGFKLLKQFRPIVRRQLTDEWKAAERFRPDLIIYHPKAIGAAHIGERLGCPTVLASPLPGFTPTREFASPMMPFRSVGPLNRLSHGIMAGGGDALFRGMIAEWRISELGLSRRPRRSLAPSATLYAYSPHVVPRPTDWPGTACVTGYWFLKGERGWDPDPALMRFLSAGEAPVYVGFGSMPGLDPELMTKTIVDALAYSGKRGVLATGGGAINDVTADHVYMLDQAPHDWLFPLMAACVHHGGAGTTAAAFKAGKPQIICPFFGDQPFWGRIVHDLGVGPAILDRKRLMVESLVYALVQVTADVNIRNRAKVLGHRISAESGVVHALNHLKNSGLIPANLSG